MSNTNLDSRNVFDIIIIIRKEVGKEKGLYHRFKPDLIIKLDIPL